MNAFRQYDLVAVVALCLLQVALVFAGIEGVVRVASGFLFVVVLPGYALLAVAYRPCRPEFGRLEHVALSMPLSLAVGATLGLLANRVQLGVAPERQVSWLAILTVTLALAGIVRSARISDREQHPTRKGSGWQAVPLFGLLVGVALALGVVAHWIDQPDESPPTALYIAGPDGAPTSLPLTATASVPFPITVGVTHEGESSGTFLLTSSTGTREMLTLAPGQTWERVTDVTLTQPGLQQVTWTLSSPDSSMEERVVHLWVRVD